jgi:PTS system galactitol-specific IIC component
VSHVLSFINWVLALGPAEMMPIIIFILCMIFRMPVMRSVRASLLIGVGFVAIYLVIGMLTSTLGPAAEGMVKNVHVHLPIIDVGWPVAAAVAFGTAKIVPWIFLLGILLNVALIALKWVKTLDVDMWNYWHFIFGAAVVYALTGNFFLGIAVGLVTIAITLKLADTTGPITGDYYGLPNITLPTGGVIDFAPVGWCLNKVIDRIPGLNRVQASPSNIQERFGVVGEPMFIGVVLGGVIGVLAHYPLFVSDFASFAKDVITTAITLGAAMLLLPRVVGILMEGLVPLADGAQKFLTTRFPGRDLYIGLDSAVVIGFPNNMSTALIMVPITLILAVLMSFLDFNHMLPFTDLAALPFFAIWATTWSRGNIVRGVIIASVFVLCMLTIGTFLAGPQTALAHAAHFSVPGVTKMSSLDTGAHLITFVLAFGFLLHQLSAYGTGFLIWTMVLIVGIVISYIIYFVHYFQGHEMGMDDKFLYVPKAAITPEVDGYDLPRSPELDDDHEVAARTDGAYGSLAPRCIHRAQHSNLYTASGVDGRRWRWAARDKPVALEGAYLGEAGGGSWGIESRGGDRGAEFPMGGSIQCDSLDAWGERILDALGAGRPSPRTSGVHAGRGASTYAAQLREEGRQGGHIGCGHRR